VFDGQYGAVGGINTDGFSDRDVGIEGAVLVSAQGDEVVSALKWVVVVRESEPFAAKSVNCGTRGVMFETVVCRGGTAKDATADALGASGRGPSVKERAKYCGSDFGRKDGRKGGEESGDSVGEHPRWQVLDFPPLHFVSDAFGHVVVYALLESL
jgi:hypothetical protein